MWVFRHARWEVEVTTKSAPDVFSVEQLWVLYD